MPRRPAERHLLTCAMTDEEHAIVEDMKQRFGLTSDANLVRTVLWSWLDDQDIDLPRGAFDLREHHKATTGSDRSDAQQWKKRKPPIVKKAPAATPRPKPKAPKATHPWRGWTGDPNAIKP